MKTRRGYKTERKQYYLLNGINYGYKVSHRDDRVLVC